MVSVLEAAGGGTDLFSALSGGLDALSKEQTVTFTRYQRVVLPLDGSVFWVRADLLGPAAAPGSMLLNAAALGSRQPVERPAATIAAKGSLHYTSTQGQAEDSNTTINRVVFTSEREVQDLNDADPQALWVGEFEGLRFAFSSRGFYYRQAALHHYVGDAVYPWMATQLVDDPAQLDQRELVVSNSLPAWLAMGLPVPVFPSYLVPENLRPPYVAVHIPPEATRPLQALPAVDGLTGSTSQLAADRVRLTLYGLNSYAALDLVQRVYDCIGYDGDVLGLMNQPVVRDGKRGQNELAALAQQKFVDFEVSYYQSRVREVALRYILGCVPAYLTAGSQPARWNNFNWDSGALWWDGRSSSWGQAAWGGSLWR